MTSTKPLPPAQQGRAAAGLAGIIFLAGTVAILFEDVLLHGHALTVKHLITLVILAGTVMSMHLAHNAANARHWLAIAGFGLVAIVGTFLVVYNSTGRQTADAIQTTAQIEETNARRAEILDARATDARRLDETKAEVKDACDGGEGRRCRGAKATLAVYIAAMKGHDADMAALGPTQVSNPEAEQFAEVVSVILDMDKAKAKAVTVLGAPFLVTLFLEFGSIVSFGYAFRPAQRPAVLADRPELSPEQEFAVRKAEALADRSLPSPLAELFVPEIDDANGSSADVVQLFPHPQPDPNGSGGPKGGKRISPARKAEILADIQDRTDRGERFVSQRALAKEYDVSTSSLSEWLRDHTVTRRQEGRRKIVGG